MIIHCIGRRWGLFSQKGLPLWLSMCFWALRSTYAYVVVVFGTPLKHEPLVDHISIYNLSASDCLCCTTNSDSLAWLDTRGVAWNIFDHHLSNIAMSQ